MSNEIAFSVNGSAGNCMREWNPTDLGLSAKTMKATAAVAYTSNMVDISGCTNFQLVAKTALSGTISAGACKLSVILYDRDQTVVSPTQDVATAISTQVDGACALVAWGGGVAPASIGGTIVANIGAVRGASFAKIVLTVSTESNAATTNTESVWFWAWAA